MIKLFFFLSCCSVRVPSEDTDKTGYWTIYNKMRFSLTPSSDRLTNINANSCMIYEAYTLLITYLWIMDTSLLLRDFNTVFWLEIAVCTLFARISLKAGMSLNGFQSFVSITYYRSNLCCWTVNGSVLYRVCGFLCRFVSTRGSLLKVSDQHLQWLYQIWASLCMVPTAGEKEA